MTDEELMKRYVAEDDEKAFDELYQRYSTKVYSYLMKHCWNKSDAEEIYQNVFLKVHRRRQLYDSKYPYSAWLFTIVKTTMIDEFRKKQTQEKIVQQSEVQGQENDVQELELPNDLEDSQKKLLELRYLQEWSFEEIAREFKMNTAAVRKRISRILRQLRGEYE